MKVTTAGSMPGTDFRGCFKALLEELPEVMVLPELPARGIGSAMVGRALGLIDTLGFDVQPAGWRLTSHSGPDQRRAQAQWRQDLDDAEELLQGYEGSLKIAIAGPWTLAATVERPRGDRILADHGARRELAQALAQALDELKTQLRRRLPHLNIQLQIDEPSLIAVRDGKIATASGFSRHRIVDSAELATALKGFSTGAILHCCAPGRWLTIAQQAGFETVSVDSRLVDLDELATWVDQSRGVILGVVETSSAQRQDVDSVVREALRVLRLIDVAPTGELLLGTACGLAGWKPSEVTQQLQALNRAAGLVAEALSRG